MAANAAWFAAGIFGWTLIEYLVHGVLSHMFRTFATPLHDAHHRDPHAVFTVGAWIPVAIVTTAVLLVFRLTAASVLWLGTVTGFLSYEIFHYRIHFVEPLCAIEARLRARHLAHHFRRSDAIFGVTNRFWDRVFGSEPERNAVAAWEPEMAAIKPLSGRSNFRLIFQPWFFLTR